MAKHLPNPNPDDPTLDYPNARVAEILDQYLEHLQNGRACTREELLEKHPDISAELAEYMAGSEDAAQALADVKAAYDTAAREGGYL